MLARALVTMTVPGRRVEEGINKKVRTKGTHQFFSKGSWKLPNNLLLTFHQPELVIWPPLVAREPGKCSFYSGWLCDQIKLVSSENKRINVGHN